MHTEHLQNVSPKRVVAGWMIAAAVTSIAYVGMAAARLVGDPSTGEAIWSLIAVGIGFLFGGIWAGWRSPMAPILHGICIGLLSLVAWFIINAIAAVTMPETGWSALSPTATVGLILLQMVAAVAGASFAASASVGETATGENG